MRYQAVIVFIFTLSYLFSNDLIRCKNNDISCVDLHKDNAKTIEINKVEKVGKKLIEKTNIKFIKSDFNPNNYDFDMPNKKSKNFETIAIITVDKLIDIQTNPKHSIFKKLVHSCPNLANNINIKRLRHKDAQCTLNGGIIIHYTPEDIYWCRDNGECALGLFPKKEDERMKLLDDGIDARLDCKGTLIDELQSVCDLEK